MEKTNKQKLNLGIFVIITTLIVITAIYYIGNKQNIFGNTFRMSSVFNNVNGLQLGNNVRYSGINVGTVKDIVMINDTTICVDMIVEDKILKHIKKNAVATIGSDGLVGSMIINIIPASGVSELLEPGDTIASYNKLSTSTMLSTLNKTNENAALLTADLLKITSAINEGQGVLGLLINDSIMASDLKQSIRHIKSTSLNTSETVQELKAIINSFDYEESVAAVLFSDSAYADKVRNIISNLEKSSDEINTVLTNLNEVVSDVKNSEGTFNYVVHDTILVNDIDETMKNIKEGSVLLNENLEALKHSALLRGYFKKLEKQKLKEEKKKY
ncbi:MAG: MlaD family protein [Flavobacteriaceae bacterium]|nr:MlaD family protein [Flavobacteriaceae bacterium]